MIRKNRLHPVARPRLIDQGEVIAGSQASEPVRFAEEALYYDARNFSMPAVRLAVLPPGDWKVVFIDYIVTQAFVSAVDAAGALGEVFG